MAPIIINLVANIHSSSFLGRSNKYSNKLKFKRASHLIHGVDGSVPILLPVPLIILHFEGFEKKRAEYGIGDEGGKRHPGTEFEALVDPFQPPIELEHQLASF